MNRLKLRTSTFVLVGAAAALITAGSVLWLSAGPGHADPDDARQVAVGKTVYQGHCASCHGANFEGQPDWRIRKPDGRLPAPPHDVTGHTWHHPDEHLFRITKLGLKPPLAPEGYASDMPGFGPTLTDEEIWAVLAFIKSRWPADIRARQSGINKRASR
jgi:mono/diheme cytochrome c family protein